MQWVFPTRTSLVLNAADEWDGYEGVEAFRQAVSVVLEDPRLKTQDPSTIEVDLRQIGKLLNEINYIDGMVSSILHILQQPCIGGVAVPEQHYNILVGKCHAHLIKGAIHQLTLPDPLTLWGQQFQVKDIINTRLLTDKIRCVSVSEDMMTVVRVLTNFSNTSVQAGIPSCFTAAVARASKILKKGKKNKRSMDISCTKDTIDVSKPPKQSYNVYVETDKDEEEDRPGAEHDQHDSLVDSQDVASSEETDKEINTSRPAAGQHNESESSSSSLPLLSSASSSSDHVERHIPTDSRPTATTHSHLKTRQFPKCYVCKRRSKLTGTKSTASLQYPKMCQTCACENFKKRNQRIDLTGKYAIVTGGRIKIGFEIALKMLRDGANVVVTTRFSNDATKRFAETKGFELWKDRLRIYQLDLRDINGIYNFVEYVESVFPHLDILINNAAQTIRRPAQFYRHMLAYESLPSHKIPDKQRSLLAQSLNEFAIAHKGNLINQDKQTINPNLPQQGGKRKACDLNKGEISPKIHKTEMSDPETATTKMAVSSKTDQKPPNPGSTTSLPDLSPPSSMVPSNASKSGLSMKPLFVRSLSDYFPPGVMDEDGQQIDLRPTNSWREVLEGVPLTELLEVLMINTVAPFILNQKFKPLLTKSPSDRRFIVNVSAMEGNFSRKSKTSHHPHTNMAKAAMNMMTRTAALGYSEDGIFMTSVDTGWVSDERPFYQALHEQTTKGFTVPLDCVDGAARVYDPIVTGLNPKQQPVYAVFLKDYKAYPW